MGFVQGHSATKFIFAAPLYSCVSFSLTNPFQRAYQVSDPSTTAVTQRFQPQKVLRDYQPQLTEKKTNSERLSDLPKVTEVNNDRQLVQ